MSRQTPRRIRSAPGSRIGPKMIRTAGASEPPSLLRVLESCGWWTAAEAGDPRVRIEAATSSHTVFRVTTADGRRVVVKQVPRQALEAGRDLRRELFVYRLANWIGEVAAALPRPLHIDEQHQVLVIESLEDGPSWPGPAEAGSVSGPGVAARLGAVMAGWHRATTETGLWPSPALGVLHLPDALEHAVEGRAQATRLLMASLAGDPELSGALRSARDGWRDRSLIHGDIRRENWITAPGARGRLRLKVLDWELSGSGDPAWDLGSVVAEFVLDMVRDEAREDGGQVPRMRAFFRAYQAHGGLLEAGDAREWDHVLLCAVARLLHVACEWAELQTGPDAGPAPLVVARARALLRRRAELVALLTRRSPRRRP